MIDKELLEIPNIKWLPWIGENYFTSDTKILIVGESHYAENNEDRIREFDKVETTRDCIQDMGVDNNKYRVKFYQNIHNLLVGNKIFNTEIFWSRVSFHNFIQKTMLTNHTRPEYLDYHSSSSVFYNLLEKLTPTYCLMCGVSSINAIRNTIQSSNFTEISFKEYDKIGNSFPRIMNIMSKDEKKISLIFIKHPSQYFSYTKWNNFMINNSPLIIDQFSDL